MSSDYARVAEAIHFLETNFQAQPTLDDLAAHLHLSPFYLQRLFTRWAGISPKRFLQFLTIEHAKKLLTNAHSVLDATYDAGLSSPSRLHDLFVTVEAMTPGEFKMQGEGLEIVYGFHHTPFGGALLATTARGICALWFLDDNTRIEAIASLQSEWPAAVLVHNDDQIKPLFERIFPSKPTQEASEIKLLIKGTNFQLKVWEALLRVRAGTVSSYADVAREIGNPKAARAVGSAVSRNAVAYLIPCHRVIRQGGAINQYRWGATRKKAMLAWESAQFAM